MYISKAKQDAF
jgi:enolase